jgi:hypothetical protein
MTDRAHAIAAAGAVGLIIAGVWGCSSSSSSSGAGDDTSDSGTSDGGGASDTGSTAGKTYTGGVGIGQSNLNGTETSTVLALFEKTTTTSTLSNCTQMTSGSCTLNHCDLGDGGLPPEYGAGTVTVTGGALTAPVTLTFDSSQSSYSDSVTATPIYTPGQTFNVTATGGDVAAFSGASAAAPSDVVVTSPSGGTGTNLTYSIDETHDLDFVWSGGSAGSRVDVALSNLDDDTVALNVQCSFDGAGGTGTMPAALLTALGSFTSGYLEMYPISTSTLASSNATVTVTVQGTPTAGIATSP